MSEILDFRLKMSDRLHLEGDSLSKTLRDRSVSGLSQTAGRS
ncbi:hypothetical protein [Nostoc sp. DSM 114161]